MLNWLISLNPMELQEIKNGKVFFYFFRRPSQSRPIFIVAVANRKVPVPEIRNRTDKGDIMMRVELRKEVLYAMERYKDADINGYRFEWDFSKAGISIHVNVDAESKILGRCSAS